MRLTLGLLFSLSFATINFANAELPQPLRYCSERFQTLFSFQKATPPRIPVRFEHFNEPATGTPTYEEYMRLRHDHFSGPARIDVATYGGKIENFYRDRYKRNSILVFANDKLGESNGVSTVMGILKQGIEESTGVNVVFKSPDMYKNHKVIRHQGQEFYQGIPTEAEILKFIRETQPAAIHLMIENPANMRVKKVLEKYGIPFTTAYHTEWPLYFTRSLPKFLQKPAQSLIYAWLRSFHKDSNGVMVPSASLTEKLIAKGFKPEQLRPWSHGVDLNRFRPNLRDENLYSSLAAAQGREAKKPYLVMVARMGEEKNVQDFFKIKTEGTKFFVGPGSPEDVKRYQEMYPDVVFLGRKDNKTELPALYASADVFVFPSLTETFGLVTGEALASGTPVVAYRVQGPKDIVTSLKAGVLAPYDSKDPVGNVLGLEAGVHAALKLNRDEVRSFAEQMPWSRSVTEFLGFLKPLSPEQFAKFNSKAPKDSQVPPSLNR